MHVKTVMGWGSVLTGALALSACMPLAPKPAPAPPPAPAEAPAPKVVMVPAPAPAPDPADVASRRLLTYHEQIRQMSPQDLGNEINRLNAVVSATATAAPADAVLELALALSQQHNGGDLSRAVALLEPLSKSSAPELAPWQPLARLLLGRVAEQRRLEDQLNREAARNRDQQRTLQQLNEKLEALKAIERSMNARPPGGGATPPASAPATAPAPAPAAAPPASPLKAP